MSHTIIAPAPMGLMEEGVRCPRGSDVPGGIMEGDRPRPVPAPDPHETPGGRAGREGRPRPPHPNGLNGRGRAVPSVMPGVVPTCSTEREGASPSPFPAGDGRDPRSHQLGPRAGSARSPPRPPDPGPSPDPLPRSARTRAGPGGWFRWPGRPDQASPHAGGAGGRRRAGGPGVERSGAREFGKNGPAADSGDWVADLGISSYLVKKRLLPI